MRDGESQFVFDAAKLAFQRKAVQSSCPSVSPGPRKQLQFEQVPFLQSCRVLFDCHGWGLSSKVPAHMRLKGKEWVDHSDFDDELT